MMNFDRKRIDFITHEQVINELKKVSSIFQGQYFGKREFDKNTTSCKSTKVIDTFGSWESALKEIGISQSATRKPRIDKNDDENLVLEIIRVWKHIGHRPSKAEWESIKPKFSYSTIKQRFEGWTNACNEALNLMTNNSENEEIKREIDLIEVPIKDNLQLFIAQENKRVIPLKLRLKILKRDHYKCVLCGRNPSADQTVELHIDHILPFSKGGKTEEDNLRTLCLECNLGKGNDEKY